MDPAFLPTPHSSPGQQRVPAITHSIHPRNGSRVSTDVDRRWSLFILIAAKRYHLKLRARCAVTVTWSSMVRVSQARLGGHATSILGWLGVKFDICINASSSLEFCECVLGLSIMSAAFTGVTRDYDGSSYPCGLLDAPGSDAPLARLLGLDPGLFY